MFKDNPEGQTQYEPDAPEPVWTCEWCATKHKSADEYAKCKCGKSTEPAALAGIEPVAIAGKDYKRGDAVSFFTRVDIPKGAFIHSAATVEQLVRERDAHKADAVRCATSHLAAIAREQQLRECLRRNAMSGNGNYRQAVERDARDLLALPQDDTALRQWGAKLLREMAAAKQLWTASEIRRKADELEGKS